jgi:hypothetical protein
VSATKPLRIETAAIEFEWRANKGPQSRQKKANPRLNASLCWNQPFWYGDGSPATERSVIIRRRDFMRLMKLAREALS